MAHAASPLPRVWFVVPCSYTYKVSLVKNTEYKITQVIPERGAVYFNRTLMDRHALRIAVEQEGVCDVMSCT